MKNETAFTEAHCVRNKKMKASCNMDVTNVS